LARLLNGLRYLQMTLVCPLCSAKPGQDCETVSGIALPLVHVARIKTAAARDAAKREHRPTSAYEIESRDAEEKLAARWLSR
jgi:hypothetical protein